LKSPHFFSSDYDDDFFGMVNDHDDILIDDVVKSLDPTLSDSWSALSAVS